jgi:hypothetical protein
VKIAFLCVFLLIFPLTVARADRILGPRERAIIDTAVLYKVCLAEPVYYGPRRSCLMTKNRGQKSRDTVPLIRNSKLHFVNVLSYFLW